jgi:hypothetical protein
MPIITIDQVKNIRQALKQKYPTIKFSVTRENYSTVDVSLISGNIDFSDILQENGYISINHYYIDERYNDHKEFFKSVRDIIYSSGGYNDNNEYSSSDYGTFPDFYVHISVGKYDKPYKYKKRKKGI